MEQLSYRNDAARLDAVFHALADGTRRAILTGLVSGQQSVKEIAAPFKISQPAVSRHLKVLERAGLIERAIDEQRRPARLKPDKLLTAVGWLADFRPLWGSAFDELDNILAQLSKTPGGDPQ